MFNKYIKLVIAAGIITLAVFQFIDDNIMNGISLILLSGVFVFFYFKNEFILLAFLQLRKQDFEKCQKWLSYIKNPSSALIKKQEGYYNFLQGIMVSQTNLTQAEKFFKIFADSSEQVRKKWFPEKKELFTVDFNKYPEKAEDVIVKDFPFKIVAEIWTESQKQIELLKEKNRKKEI